MFSTLWTLHDFQFSFNLKCTCPFITHKLLLDLWKTAWEALKSEIVIWWMIWLVYVSRTFEDFLFNCVLELKNQKLINHNQILYASTPSALPPATFLRSNRLWSEKVHFMLSHRIEYYDHIVIESER